MVLPHDQLNNRGENHLAWEAWRSTSPFTHAIPCADSGAFPEKSGTDGIHSKAYQLIIEYERMKEGIHMLYLFAVFGLMSIRPIHCRHF